MDYLAQAKAAGSAWRHYVSLRAVVRDEETDRGRWDAIGLIWPLFGVFTMNEMVDLTGISIYSLENIKDQIKRVKEKMREDGDTYGINN